MTENKERRKLSASALNTFLKSPKAFYWSYIAKLTTAMPSVATFDHDKLCGQLWAETVDRFYRGVNEKDNLTTTLNSWHEQTDGWVPEKAKAKLTGALESWTHTYYQLFRPDDGCRGDGKSELLLENERFLGYLDGLSDEGIVHEVKSTSRSPQLAGQLWKVQNSIQVKLYCVLANAKGHQIEFAFKDPPYAIYRGPVVNISDEQRACWERELNALADFITSLGDSICNYPCHSDGCCLTTKGGTWMCQYETLCDMGLTDETKIGFKTRTSNRKP